MSFRSTQQNTLSSKAFESDTWVRPSDWLDLPAVTETEEKAVLLAAVFNKQDNFVSIKAAGDFTIDWGDGTVTNYTSGTTAEHNYDYNSLALDGSESFRGYKQAVITVTPQAGQTFTLFDINKLHSSIGLGNRIVSPFLDITISSPNLSTLLVSALSGADVPLPRMMERFVLLSKGVGLTSFESLFLGCRSLREVSMVGAGVTNCTNMFRACSSLRYVKLFDTSAVTTMNLMFFSCKSLAAIPLFNTSSVNDMDSMLNGCNALLDVPLINTSSVTTMSSMFNGCSTIRNIPRLNTSNVTKMDFMFFECRALHFVPLLNTSKVTTTVSMFQSCTSLKDVSLLDLSSATATNDMFYSCFSLQSIPPFNLSSATNITNMFRACNVITSVPLLTPSASMTAALNLFLDCYVLNKLDGSNIRKSFSIQNAGFGSTELDALYTSLPTITGQTLTVTGNYGAGASDPSIATAKGWTVTA